jgi:hypothetical protein
MLRIATGVVMMALGVTTLAASSARPHIALIVSDDLGWDDVGFRRVICMSCLHSCGWCANLISRLPVLQYCVTSLPPCKVLQCPQLQLAHRTALLVDPHHHCALFTAGLCSLSAHCWPVTTSPLRVVHSWPLLAVCALLASDDITTARCSQLASARCWPVTTSPLRVVHSWPLLAVCALLASDDITTSGCSQLHDHITTARWPAMHVHAAGNSHRLGHWTAA